MKLRILVLKMEFIVWNATEFGKIWMNKSKVGVHT